MKHTTQPTASNNFLSRAISRFSMSSRVPSLESPGFSRSRRIPGSNRIWISAGILLLVIAVAGFAIRIASAQTGETEQAQVTPLHPVFAFLDASGTNVLEGNTPISTMKTCGQCHDTDFIASHSFHSDLGLADIQAGKASTGLFGQWDALDYRYLSQSGDARLDLGTAGWIILNADRFVGGGPGTTSRNGQPLTDLTPSSADPETSVLDPQTGKSETWRWDQSGMLEMDCFLCHLPAPDNQARIAAIQSGEFGWANSATLQGTGLITKTAQGWKWNTSAFDSAGLLLQAYTAIQEPGNDNCGQCHGLVHMDAQTALTLPACSDTTSMQTATTGQVISPQLISESGVNLPEKESLTRSWDIHSERGLQCVDCHFSLNNPIYYQENAALRPDSLLFDPRRIDLSEYLRTPDHNLARGQSAQYQVAPGLKGSMRRCESCHDANMIHSSWLPYVGRHMAVVACETCHIPQLYAAAIRSEDWTVVTLNGQAAVTCRGAQGSGSLAVDLVNGYQPVLMSRLDIDGGTSLAPYNLITTWYWAYDDNGQTLPVRQFDLEAAYLSGGKYAEEVLAVFDQNSDGAIDSSELAIDSDAKRNTIAARLSALGLENPHILGQVQPYSINHDVAGKGWAIKDCQACHSRTSRLAAPIKLAASVPAGVMPAFVSNTNVNTTGEVYVKGGALFYQPATAAEGRYLFGYSRLTWVDWLGGLFFLGVLAGVVVHSGMRIRSNRRQAKPAGGSEKVYMYQSYERFWHWLQTSVIVLLLITGLIIHRPGLFSSLFRGVVIMHNVLWVILGVNAALSLFYHLVSGQIKQFIPRPYGFFDDAIVQTRYYLRGIFKHEPHPFEKTPARKMNPLQQVTYLVILNVLLPLQGLTGILMWGVQKWPALAGKLGGLPFLAPFHTLVAWLFAAFILGHVYLTTTAGSRPLQSIKGMVTGWEELETSEAAHADETAPEKESKS
jgi:thiosulfate reductase cytochrome b subunit